MYGRLCIKLAERRGVSARRSFRDNPPKDTKDYPQGVWTLPAGAAPQDVDKEKYLAIGESDRMTLKL